MVRILELVDRVQLHGERRRAEVTSSLLQPHRSDLILDVGCGDGYQMFFIAKHVQHAIGIDTSFYKLKEAKMRVKEADFIRATVQKLPFQPAAFNKVLCLELLEHVEDPSKALNEIDLVLKKGGTLIVSVPYRERIRMIQCVHCGKLTPLWGHLHSFDEEKLSSLLPRNYSVLRREYIGTPVSSYLVFSHCPTRLWKIIDNLSRLLLGFKPYWFINKVQKLIENSS